ncbi:metalloprotease [Flavobacterium amnicola]|uniref:Metalloprotease n=1 Tax=Flavobacterium amnicola TaxID=2506422 RepID=A0A4Q1K004_9FLAO|nr:metalloprotease [Flavobacterium amnicola]RXR16268.1 metalloprotease [Flavobacterium amnicola]
MKKNVLLFGALALTTIFACSKEDETTTLTNEQPAEQTVKQPSGIENECSYVDAYWPSSAVLSTTLSAGAGTSSDVTLMNNQNSAIKTFWRGTTVAAPTFRFVQNGTNWSSTYNAISYSTGRIYYGEGIFRDAKSKDASNLVNVMILAHEYGHQLQYAFGLPSKKESTARPNELEADGMAGYYLRRGYGKTTFSSISTAYEFAYAIGDYQTTSSGHHGTPPQRRSAVRLGFLLADPANAKLTASQFDYNFFYYYNGVLAGTYRLAKPSTISNATHQYILSHMEELKRIQSGEMSDTEYFNLD